MVRGGRGYSSRGSSYRGSSRGNRWNNGGGYGRSPRDRYGFDDGYDKGRFAERYPRDEYPKAYRVDNYSRDRHSPERKRPRNEGPSRHEYGGGRYESYPPERRGYSSERHLASPYASRREEYRKPPPPPSPRGGGRGRVSSRGSRGLRRERGRGGPPRRRLADRSYVIKRRGGIRSEFSRRSSKVIRIRSAIARRKRLVDSEKESSDDEEEKEVKVKKEKAEKTEEEDVEMKEGDAEKEEPKEGDEGEDGAEKSKEKKEKKEKTDEEKKKKKIFITLVCPHCRIKVPTFRRYEAHLEGRTHLLAMRKVAAKQRTILAQMRQAQRNSQNELEKTGDGITDHTVFCPLCKLNYKQERAVHQATAAHKNMKKFLMPTCKVCKVTYKSPMVYEHHLCTIDHIKRKQKQESAAGGENEEDNLEEFTTIDSVGEVGDENAASTDEQEKAEKKKKVSVGIEQIKRIEAHYCDLCRMFLPRGTENEYPDILAGHCRKRFHMQRYIRFKENEDLKKKAEKLQRKELAEKEKTGGDSKKEGEDVEMADGAGEESKELDASKSADDDKLWDAVDKDLGELLEETDGREDDDDEERVNGERYDRFKSAEKEKNGEAVEGGEAPAKAEEGKKAEESK